MGHRILSFHFDEDGLFDDAVSTATYNYSLNLLTVEAASLAIADLPNIAQAVDELVNQDPGDGTVFTQNTTAGGTVVIYNPVPTPHTIKIGNANPWNVDKAQSFIDGLDLA